MAELRPSPSPSDDLEDDDLQVSALDPARPRSWHGAPLAAASTLRRLWRASGVVALVALVAILVVALAPRLPRLALPRVTPPYTALGVSSDVARCLTGVSWSRDGRQIAATQDANCGAPYLGPPIAQGNLLIFDAASGHQVAAFNLDDAVSAALRQMGVPNSFSQNYETVYVTTSWSPDDRLLAVGFVTYSPQMQVAGEAVVTMRGAARGRMTILTTPLNGDISVPTATGFQDLPNYRWDLVDDSQSVIYLAPALVYRWLPSDVLVADEPLPASASATAPSAPAPAANDGRTISLWSVGTVTPVTATACGPNGATITPLRTPYALLTLGTLTWSPDGRYLIELGIQARLNAYSGHPAPSASGRSPCDAGPAPDQLASAPFHDQGMRAALRLLDPYGGNQLGLAWSPDGRRLAVLPLNIAQNVASLSLYDSASGAVRQRFTADEFEVTPSASDSVQDAEWSPDSAHLLLTISGPVAKLVILGPPALAT